MYKVKLNWLYAVYSCPNISLVKSIQNVKTCRNFINLPLQPVHTSHMTSLTSQINLSICTHIHVLFTDTCPNFSISGINGYDNNPRVNLFNCNTMSYNSRQSLPYDYTMIFILQDLGSLSPSYMIVRV